MADWHLQTDVSFQLFLKEAIDVELPTLSGRTIQILGSIKGKTMAKVSGKTIQILGALKAKLWPKCLTDLKSEEWKGGPVR